MYYVYIIKNELHKFYYGYTSDLRKRMIDHNAGQCQSTKGHIWRLVYYEAYLSKRDAMEREMQLKRFGQTWAHLRRRIKFSILQSKS